MPKQSEIFSASFRFSLQIIECIFFTHRQRLANLMQYFISILSYATYAIRCVIFPFFVHSGLFYLQGPKNFLFSFNFLECLFSIKGMENICIPGMENFQDSSKKENEYQFNSVKTFRNKEWKSTPKSLQNLLENILGSNLKLKGIKLCFYYS